MARIGNFDGCNETDIHIQQLFDTIEEFQEEECNFTVNVNPFLNMHIHCHSVLLNVNAIVRKLLIIFSIL